MPLDTVFIQSLHIETIIGVHAFEQNAPRPLLIDLEMGTDIREAASSDRIRERAGMAPGQEAIDASRIAIADVAQPVGVGEQLNDERCVVEGESLERESLGGNHRQGHVTAPSSCPRAAPTGHRRRAWDRPSCRSRPSARATTTLWPTTS